MAVSISTDQGDRLKTAFESMRDFVSEVRLSFRRDGIELLGQDKAHVVLVRYILPAKKIRDTGGQYMYEASAPAVEVGIKTKLVANSAKCASPGDMVSMGVDPEIPGRLVFTCQNGAKMSRWEIVTPELPEDIVDPDTIDAVQYSGSVTMSSALFHDMIRDLSTADAMTVKLCCDGQRLILSTEGLMTRVSFEVADGQQQQQQNKLTASFDKKSATEWPVCESYALTFLQRIAKAKNICSKVTIFLKPGYPAAFVYNSPIGSFTYIVMPRDEEDLGAPRMPQPPAQLYATANKRAHPSSSADITKAKKAKKNEEEEEQQESDDEEQ
jgi:hypothetical protein